jgi:hypothetical protein
VAVIDPAAQSQDSGGRSPSGIRGDHENKPLEGEVRTINVHALGPSGSGKTVFMAAMYRQLRIKRGNADFYLSTDHATAVHMNSVYNAVANPEDEWPASTRVPSEWEFGLTVSTVEGDFEALKLKYLDYPGATLTAPRAAEDEKFQKVIEQLKSAHALLVLLDGAGVLACLRGQPQGRRFLDFELSRSLEIVQQNRCPVHFVVTKWDLLEDAHTLGEVRDLLLEDETFRDLIRGRQEIPAGPIRLIPVSSVGSGFAAMQPNGQMRKLGQPARPDKVHLPFCSVLPDVTTHLYAELQATEQGLLSRVQRQVATPKSGTAARAGRLAAAKDVARRVLASQLAKQLMARNPTLAALLPANSEDLANALFFVYEEVSRRAMALTEKRRAADAAQVAALRAGVHDQLSALQLVQAQFQEILAQFERDYPESLLTGGFIDGAGDLGIGQDMHAGDHAIPTLEGTKW